MSLAKRVREFRYLKGWGPDELAQRASVSRTALYQIECGRTHSPRAGTLLKIAKALDIPIERLIGDGDSAAEPGFDGQFDPAIPFEPAVDSVRDLDLKFRELLASHLGQGLARLVEDSHRLLPGRQGRSIG